MKRPKRPDLMTVGLPQFSQNSPVGSSLISTFGSLRSASSRSFGTQPVKLREHAYPVGLALLDQVEVALHRRRVVQVHDVLEVLAEQVVHGDADFGRHEAAVGLRDVLARAWIVSTMEL